MLTKDSVSPIKEDVLLGEKFLCLRIHNQNSDDKVFKKDIDASYIQFHFCLKGDLDFIFNEGNYSLNLSTNKFLILYNPKKDLPVNINLKSNSIFISALISINKFHKLFSQDGHKIDFLSGDNSNQKYYKELEINNSMLLVLNQMLKYRTSSITKDLYLKSKIYEIFSLIFNSENNNEDDKCPFILNDDQLRKIRLAKDIILERFNEPPTLVELSEEINLGLRQLKQGFKETYGKPVFQYLLDYKMDKAAKLLSDGKYNVNEVSIELGYSNSSHFIHAFKKKFGITPLSFIKQS
ncbi:MAG: helix-turn-helix transcriptional regulator [Flavobacteriales bacterium]|nr:helix-turn-helix transcriptional regulator [Flavobacteriales bacterium]|tara:strand:- start:64 stop:945 length:882 start_codon:yes stop_codon:yes gene_type:complete